MNDSGAGSLPEFRQAADDAIGMRDSCLEVGLETMLAEHLQERAVDALQQFLSPVIRLDRLRQHVDEMDAIARVDEIRRAVTEEIRFTELAQLLRIDMVQVDVEAGRRLQKVLQGVRVVVGRRVDIGIPAPLASCSIFSASS